jgi:hypothetical protein
LSKEFSIPNVLIFQSIVFGGYLSGRKIVSLLAKKLDGFKAIVIAESGMVITILMLIVFPSSLFLYPLCFFLGIFTRGTSPVIKAMAFDQLDKRPAATRVRNSCSKWRQRKRHGTVDLWVVVNGVWGYGPFMASAICASLVAVACIYYRAGRVHGS